MRQGPGIGQGPMNSGGLYICIGPGGGPGPTRGGSLMFKLNFWAVFPYSWAETVPSLQLNQKSNVPWVVGRRSGCQPRTDRVIPIHRVERE